MDWREKGEGASSATGAHTLGKSDTGWRKREWQNSKRVATGGDPSSHLPSFFFLFHDLVRATPGVEVPTVHAEDELDRSRREDGSDMRFYGRKWSH